jgi:hypothetical protein
MAAVVEKYRSLRMEDWEKWSEGIIGVHPGCFCKSGNYKTYRREIHPMESWYPPPPGCIVVKRKGTREKGFARL